MRVPRHTAVSALLLLLPALSPASAQTISDKGDFAKNVEMSQETLAEFGRYDNPVEMARINRIGFELAQQSGYLKYPFTFDLVDTGVPNAVSLGAGQVFVT